MIIIQEGRGMVVSWSATGMGMSAISNIVLNHYFPEMYSRQNRETVTFVQVVIGAAIGFVIGLWYLHKVNKLQEDISTRKKGKVMYWLEIPILIILNSIWIIFCWFAVHYDF